MVKLSPPEEPVRWAVILLAEQAGLVEIPPENFPALWLVGYLRGRLVVRLAPRMELVP